MSTRTVRWSLFLAALLTAASVGSAAPIGPVGPGDKPPEEIAREHLKDKRPDLAIQVLLKAIDKEPRKARLNYWLGVSYVRNNQHDLAEARFRDVLKLDPDFVEAHTELARLLVRRVSPATRSNAENLAFLNGAIQHMQQAVQKSPHDARLLYHLAELHIDTARFREKNAEGAFEEATKVLEEARKKAPNETRPYMALGHARTRHARFLAGETRFAELTGNKAAVCKQLLDRAIQDFKRALAVNPRFLGALDRIAAIHSSRGDLDEAVATFERHLKKLEGPREKATCYRSMAQYLLLGNRLTEAEAKLGAAIKMEPKEFASYLLLANILIQRDQLDEAAKNLRKAIEINKNFLNAHVEIGVLEKNRRRNITEAAKHFRNALQIAPARAVVVSRAGRPLGRMAADLYTRAAVELADIHTAKREFDEAIVVLRRLSEILPWSPLPDHHIGEVYRRKPDYERAKEHFGKALRLDKNFWQARVSLALLEASRVRFAPTPKEQAKVLERAIDQLDQALERVPNNAALLDRVAALRMQLADCSTPKSRAALEKALATAARAVDLKPDEAAYRRRLAGIHHDLGNNKGALKELNTLIKNATEQVSKAPKDIGALYRLADLYATLNNWQPEKATLQKAVDGFARTTELQPEFLRGYLRAAAVLERAKDHSQAVEWYKKLLKAAQGDRSLSTLPLDRSRMALHATAELAWIYCEYLNQLDEADKYAKLALRINPNLSSLLDTVGWIHYKKKEYGVAIPFLRRAFRGAPRNATVGYHLGAALVKHDNPGRARKPLLEAKKHVGNDKDLAKKIDALLRQVGG